jgi:hypothetical protein
MSSSDYVVKPLATAGVALAIDQFFFNESDLNKSITFAVSSGAGAYLGMMVGSSLPDLSNTLPTFLGNGKGLLQRVAEVGFGVGSSYAVNKFVLKNNTYKENMMNKLGALVVADIAGEYISDYIAGRPLSIVS